MSQPLQIDIYPQDREIKQRRAEIDAAIEDEWKRIGGGQGGEGGLLGWSPCDWLRAKGILPANWNCKWTLLAAGMLLLVMAKKGR